MPEGFDDILLIAAVFAAVFMASLWLSLVIWAYRDMRQRSRDTLAQALVALLVLLLNGPGIVVYILLRPRETLSEVYERSLEEEALLQEIEEKPACPNCSQRVERDWQACPHCHTRLKKICVECGYLLDLSWNICPHCIRTQVSFNPEDTRDAHPRHAQPIEPAPIDAKWVAS